MEAGAAGPRPPESIPAGARLRLESRSRDELENRAKELHIRGASRKTKSELVKEIRKKER